MLSLPKNHIVGGLFSRRLILTSLMALALMSALGGPGLAQDVTSNSVTLTWTSPGDDGNSGTASEYDIRYSTSLITAANWDAATQATGEPSPQPAGSSETFTVDNLQSSTTYYFAVRAAICDSQ